MKIFAVYANLKLTKQPEWLDVFREKYNQRYHPHITLKQPRFIEEEKISDLKQKFLDFFKVLNVPNHKIELVFNELVYDTDEDGTTIMLRVSNPNSLINIQKNLRETLKDYVDYVKPRSQNYEENFDPHVTIGADLPESQRHEALEYFKNDYRCEGFVEEIVLCIVTESTPEEANNPANQTVFSL